MSDEIDEHMGRRLMNRRRSLGVTQQQLATVVGVRFQQIYKYECGENRISAARLWMLAIALDVTVDYFYEGLPVGFHIEKQADGGVGRGIALGA